jgi:hypothetical protein
MAKKPSEIPERENPTPLPPEEPIEPSWPNQEPEIKPATEPAPLITPKEIPPSPGVLSI